MRNVESKFRCAAHEAVLARAVEAGASDEEWLHQRDQFYEVPRGRLKLRTIEGRGSELIAYERDDTHAARVSEFARYATLDTTSLADVLERALSRVGVVEKERHLLILRNTRIHLDDVVGLGRFVELETVITTQSEAESEHRDVIHLLGLDDGERVAVAYVDLSKSNRQLDPPR